MGLKINIQPDVLLPFSPSKGCCLILKTWKVTLFWNMIAAAVIGPMQCPKISLISLIASI